MNNRRFYISDFREDLNYEKIILYVGNVNLSKLLKRLDKDCINKLYRFDYAIKGNNLLYIENCDLHDIDEDCEKVSDYLEKGYAIFPLKEEPAGYYVEF